MDATEPRPPLPTVVDWCRDEIPPPEGEWLEGWVAEEGESDEEGCWTPLLRDGGEWFLTFERTPISEMPRGLRVVAWAPAPELLPPSVRYVTTLHLLEAFKHEERRAGSAEAFGTAADLAETDMAEPFRQAQQVPRPPGTVPTLRTAWEDVVKHLRDLAAEEEPDNSPAGCPTTETAETP